MSQENEDIRKGDYVDFTIRARVIEVDVDWVEGKYLLDVPSVSRYQRVDKSEITKSKDQD